MALKNTQIPITMTEYEKIMGELITKYKDTPIHESMIKLLEEASKYRIVDVTKMRKFVTNKTITRKPSKRSNHISHKGKKAKKLKIYHDITCNCYDCRAGLSLRAKD